MVKKLEKDFMDAMSIIFDGHKKFLDSLVSINQDLKQWIKKESSKKRLTSPQKINQI